jgi:uncharacterized protein YqgC (DUF456 family)
MIGKIVSALAGRSIAQTVGGASAGPAGALVGAAIPLVLPRIARTLGPVGMIAAAVGGVLFTRWLERRNARLAADATIGGRASGPGAAPGGTPPDVLEGELLRDPR